MSHGLAQRPGIVPHRGLGAGGQRMRGEVLHYDEDHGFGFINGADGNRYTFAREDLRRTTLIATGAEVEFVPAGGQAREVFWIRAQGAGNGTAASATAASEASAAPPAMSLSAASQPRRFGRLPQESSVPDGSLWGYFWRDVTRNHVNFAERARRKEFWGYCLCWVAGLILVGLLGALGDQSIGNFDDGTGPMLTIGVSVLFMLGTFLPWLGLVVRRLHDIGLSGWLALLMFIPTIGTLALLVFGLIPSQGQANQWGPVPEGARA
jgi:uncharacterized membrane protein YhaH (DUF805 family)/cold shock CspA family protein